VIQNGLLHKRACRDSIQVVQVERLASEIHVTQKLQWIQGAYDAGIREIEVGSFVPPKLLPQLADTAELVAFAKT
jgi:hydroxymethylglutaryl-CoA lyase